MMFYAVDLSKKKREKQNLSIQIPSSFIKSGDGIEIENNQF